jgi:tetratricopeptide (TPR) repeat protein
MRQFRLRTASVLVALLSALLAAAPAADARSHVAPAPAGQVGKVDFPTSCAPEVRGQIEKGLALLHSFQYQVSEQAFTDGAQKDSRCAIAYWGQAMALYHQLWDFPKAETIAQGRKYLDQARDLGTGTPREREYIAAAAAFYQDDPKLTHTARTQAYSAAMGKLHGDFPGDVEAAAFYALSLVALADAGVDEMPNRKKAIAILDPLFQQEPDNPGVAHYLIHAADTPELASQGLPAARAYAKIAPDSSHAIHMPSHIFRRLGLWQEMIDSNVAASAAAANATQSHQGDASYEFHALDFLDYAYLQSGQEAKARNLVDQLKSVPGARGEDLVQRQASLEAVNAIELHHWTEAASLSIPNERLMWQDPTFYARAIGEARIGKVGEAQQDFARLKESLAAMEAHTKELGNQPDPGAGVEQSEAEAWIAYASGKHDDALAEMRSASSREESQRADPISVPAREMLADLLLELKRPSEALTEYEAVLKDYPNRFDALYGAAHAAESAAQPRAAREYYAKLVAISAPAADRPELREARYYVAANGN